MDKYSEKDILGYKQLHLAVYLMLYLGLGLFSVFFILGMCFLFIDTSKAFWIIGVTFISCSALYLITFIPMFFIFNHLFLKSFKGLKDKRLVRVEGTIVGLEKKNYSMNRSSFQSFGIKVSFEDQIQLLGTLEKTINHYIPISVGFDLREGDKLNLLETEDQEVFILKDWKVK